MMRSTFAVREFTADSLPNEVLYEILENMGTRPVNDPEQQQSIMDAYNGFKQKNAIITNGGKIIPDSIYVKYTN